MQQRRPAPGPCGLAPGILGLAMGILCPPPEAAHAQQALEIARLPGHARSNLQIEQLLPARRTGRTVLELPGGQTLRLIPRPVERSVDGTSTLTATEGDARMVVTTDGTRAYGHVIANGRTYVIETTADALAIIDADRLGGPPMSGMSGWRNDVVVADSSQQLHETTAAGFEPASKLEAGATPAAATALDDADSASVVDVALFVESRVLSQYGSQAVHTRAQASIEFTNEAFRRNGIALSLRLVYLGPLAGELPSGTGDVFEAFVSNAAAQETAARYGADLRHVLYSQDARPGLNNCGRANLLGKAGAVGFECGQNIFAHEIGHNLGAHHDRANALSPPPAAGAYNFGYICGGRGTLMSYAGAASLDHYSSPDLSFGGQACGVAIGQPDAAFNAAVIAENRAAVQAFSVPQPAYGTVRFAQDTLAIDEKGQPVAFSIVRDGDLSQPASVEVGLIDGSATEGEDVRALLERVTFSSGESTRTLVLEPLDDDAFDGPVESLRAVLRYPYRLTVAGEPLQISISGDDDPDRGKAAFSAAALSARENIGTVNVEVVRSGNADLPLTVSYVPVDESARNGTDYRLAPGQITFMAGETRRAISVEFLDDTVFQGTLTSRHFKVRLTGTNLGGSREVRLFVVDDDSAPPDAASDAGSDSGGGGGTGPLVLSLLALLVARRGWIRQTSD